MSTEDTPITNAELEEMARLFSNAHGTRGHWRVNRDGWSALGSVLDEDGHWLLMRFGTQATLLGYPVIIDDAETAIRLVKGRNYPYYDPTDYDGLTLRSTQPAAILPRSTTEEAHDLYGRLARIVDDSRPGEPVAVPVDLANRLLALLHSLAPI